jgi:hypothetical protein
MPTTNPGMKEGTFTMFPACSRPLQRAALCTALLYWRTFRWFLFGFSLCTPPPTNVHYRPEK